VGRTRRSIDIVLHQFGTKLDFLASVRGFSRRLQEDENAGEVARELGVEKLFPVLQVADGFPPTWVVYGTRGKTVLFEEVMYLKTLVEAAGSKCKLVPVKGGGYGAGGEDLGGSKQGV